ncbi:MAG TPA: nitrate- and nitrite sensing domain-containing protein, partial [Actinomycetes bacterium]|nr:nitrate- and nitrite sensing domain-containing protein [Actinomycetes bacterium]
MPYTGALTDLVHELQRERSLSGDRSAGPALEGARRTVDGAAADYRDAAVRVEISDRDRRLHQRLDTGLAQLAGLTALRASVDGPAGTGQAATVFRRYTEIVGGLLAVNAEIGLSEAGRDAGLVRAVTAATAFSRAKELADREREAAAQVAAGRRLDQAERTRLAFLGGRQDALLDQFAALASREQLARYARAFSTEEIEQATRLRRAALEGGSGQGGSAQGGSGQGGSAQGGGPDLAGWADAAAVRVERMRTVELGLAAETARLAGLGDRAADRRALAYAAAFLLAASALVVLLVLAPGRARRAKEARAARKAAAARTAQEAGKPRESRRARRAREAAPDPATAHAAPDPANAPAATRKPRRSLPSPSVGERSRAAKGAAPVVHSPLADPARGADPAGGADPAHAADPGHAVGPGIRPDPALVVGPGLADLARRSQDLVDQQLELLDQAGRDQGDPKLPGRLLQVDRLAVRARRNAHNLIVLAGGEPARHWDGPAPLAEVAALAVRDNPDASRVDLDVAGELLVAGPAAEDLANLLAELVDNATAFSAPETRVRVGGQEVGSGYVLEVEDRGLGMTDGELEAVNRRLSGDPAAGDDLEQRLGTWVAGRLARRHDVRVQLRRSPYGGVTALVFLPELLVVAAEPVAPVGPGGPPPDVGEGGDAALASLPLRRYVTQVPEADPPLPKRPPHANLAPDLAAADPGDPATRPAARSPEQVRNMLTRYRSGLERGRAAA